MGVGEELGVAQSRARGLQGPGVTQPFGLCPAPHTFPPWTCAWMILLGLLMDSWWLFSDGLPAAGGGKQQRR
jgi:hypothetical protein